MNILAIDTSESRGSVAVLRDGTVTAVTAHASDVDYSEWLLPAVNEMLRRTGMTLQGLGLIAVSTGPGSFTGLRVGLTTVKAWAEVYGTSVVGVSRLEAIVEGCQSDELMHKGKSLAEGPHTQQRRVGHPMFRAAFYDAQRGQVFGALYRREGEHAVRVEDEMVISPTEFLEWVTVRAGEEAVRWFSLDPELITNLSGWSARAATGDAILRCQTTLAPAIGRLGANRAAGGLLSDPLALDANYVRRSDAEIFWKGR